MSKFKIVSPDRRSVSIKPNGKNKKFILQYLKDETVNAIEGTFGIFVYNTLEQAKRDQYTFDGMFGNRVCRIIEVAPIGIGRHPQVCLSLHLELIEEFLGKMDYIQDLYYKANTRFAINYKNRYLELWPCFEDEMMVYPAVKVLS